MQYEVINHKPQASELFKLKPSPIHHIQIIIIIIIMSVHKTVKLAYAH